MRWRVFHALLLIGVLLPACSGQRSSGAAGTARSTGGAGSLIISVPEGLSEYNIAGRSRKPLVTPSTPNTFLLDPALSPDGRRLAYVSQPPPKIEGNRYDAGADLWVANRDGSDPHPIFEHVQANQLVRFPQWEDDSHILAIVQETTPKGGVLSVAYTLERIPVAGGERTKLIENALTLGLSADRKHAVFAQLAVQTGETLNSLDIASGQTSTLVGFDANLAPFVSPRFSPSGKMIAFASADQTGARLPAALVSVGRRGAGTAPGIRLDGLPEDIWTIDAAGSPPKRVADLKEDLPALTWGGDDRHIYVLGGAGLYDVNVQAGSVERIGEGAFHGQITWAP